MARRSTTQPKARMPAPEAPPVPPPRSGVFERLGLYGFGPLEPVLLAALATEEPLLLIGPHGTGKSLLLTRVAGALGLSFRHYNASLLNFDDLVGFPLPGKDGSLEYVRTPAAIWGAGAVIFDEISRCRPDVQNKLFPVIHEKRVQGLPLTGLRYRWAAMNPPAMEDSDEGYLGSEPLDPALADRFAFVVQMPGWRELTEPDQRAIICAVDEPVAPEVAGLLTARLAQVRASMPAVRVALAEGLAVYVQALVGALEKGGVTISPRRAGMLWRTIAAVHAAALCGNPAADLSDSAWLTLKHGLPQRAEGKEVAEIKALVAHRTAWMLADMKPGDPLRAVLSAADPLDRLRLAATATGLPKGEASAVVADALAELSPGARAAGAVHLFETGAVGRLTAAIAEQAGQLYRDIVVPVQFSEAIASHSNRFRTWNRVKDLLSKLNPSRPRDPLLANALAAAFARNELATPEDATAAFDAFRAADARLHTEAA